MPRKGQKGGEQRPPGDPNDPFGFIVLSEAFLTWMAVTNYSESTIKNRRTYLKYFIVWCDDRGLTQPQEITRPIIERYQRYLYYYRKKDGHPLSFRSQHTRLTSVRSFFKWLAKNNHILYNPAYDLELPKLEHRLPKHVLTERESEKIINEPDINEPLGIRDRAILEVLYSTGMRRMELIRIKLYDLDRDRGTVIIRQGKGKKDRMIPIGERALAWIDKYLNEVRPSLVLDPDDGTVFLTTYNEPFTKNRLTQLVRDYVNAADIGKKGACHLFRHTMATIMLENGADIRFIQQMLGHARLDTTQIYTQVSIRLLKEIHSATHPTAKLKRFRKKERSDNQPTEQKTDKENPEN
jgi:integrase/recombinase XerD